MGRGSGGSLKNSKRTAGGIRTSSKMSVASDLSDELELQRQDGESITTPEELGDAKIAFDTIKDYKELTKKTYDTLAGRFGKKNDKEFERLFNDLKVVVDLTDEGIAAHYQADSNTITMSPKILKDPGAKQVLMHETVHMLQNAMNSDDLSPSSNNQSPLATSINELTAELASQALFYDKGNPDDTTYRHIIDNLINDVSREKDIPFEDSIELLFKAGFGDEDAMKSIEEMPDDIVRKYILSPGNLEHSFAKESTMGGITDAHYNEIKKAYLSDDGELRKDPLFDTSNKEELDKKWERSSTFNSLFSQSAERSKKEILASGIPETSNLDFANTPLRLGNFLPGHASLLDMATNVIFGQKESGKSPLKSTRQAAGNLKKKLVELYIGLDGRKEYYGGVITERLKKGIENIKKNDNAPVELLNKKGVYASIKKNYQKFMHETSKFISIQIEGMGGFEPGSHEERSHEIRLKKSGEIVNGLKESMLNKLKTKYGEETAQVFEKALLAAGLDEKGLEPLSSDIYFDLNHSELSDGDPLEGLKNKLQRRVYEGISNVNEQEDV